MAVGKRLINIVLIVLLAVSWGACTSSPMLDPQTLAVTSTKRPVTYYSSSMPFSFAALVNKVLPAVVYITGEIKSTADGGVVMVDGSGVIVNSNGYILTNKHVVKDAHSVEVVMENRQRYKPTAIWKDDIMDLAVLKIDASNLTAVPFGNPDKFAVGDLVIALGHPLGMSPDQGGATVSSGIISNLGRSFTIDDTPYYDIVQTDAPISPGSSGGPLIDLNGELVGINSAGSSQGENIGFAINTATAEHIFADLSIFGVAQHPYLGVSIEDVIPSGPGSDLVGTRVTVVENGSPADQAGIQVRDVILSLDQQDVTMSSELIRSLWRHDVGSEIQIVYMHGSEIFRKNVILEQRPIGSQASSQF
jgi:serine protease Do